MRTTSSTWSSPAPRCVMSRMVRPSVAAEQVPGQLVGGLLVEVLGRLVEDEDGKIGEQHAREGKPLALTAGQSHAVLADVRVQAGGQALDPFEQPGAAQRRADLLVGGLAAGQPQVLAEGGVEDVRVLGAQPDDPPDAVAVKAGDVGPARASPARRRDQGTAAAPSPGWSSPPRSGPRSPPAVRQARSGRFR